MMGLYYSTNPASYGENAIIDHNGPRYDYYGDPEALKRSVLLSDFDATDNVQLKKGVFAR